MISIDILKQLRIASDKFRLLLNLRIPFLLHYHFDLKTLVSSYMWESLSKLELSLFHVYRQCIQSFIRKQFYKKIFAKIEPERDFRKFTTKKKKKNLQTRKVQTTKILLTIVKTRSHNYSYRGDFWPKSKYNLMGFCWWSEFLCKKFHLCSHCTMRRIMNDYGDMKNDCVIAIKSWESTYSSIYKIVKVCVTFRLRFFNTNLAPNRPSILLYPYDLATLCHFYLSWTIC